MFLRSQLAWPRILPAHAGQVLSAANVATATQSNPMAGNPMLRVSYKTDLSICLLKKP
jgi:hypothetical protein